MKSRYGHTLVELLFCLLIAGILLGAALPSFVSTVERNRQTEAVNQLLGALHYARGKAVMERKVVAICGGGNPCAESVEWRGQIVVFHDQNKDGQQSPGEDIMLSLDLPESDSWFWVNFRRKTYLQFLPDGTTHSLNGTLTLCRQNRPLQQIVINVTGRPRTRAPLENARCN
ncbi:pilus assembly protein [Pseudomonas taiwanensis]|uniref:GspH/FimT family pseudopilin n=1 Tax=Pseudomonas taiwanensis TaxID=470150 RepID=UPI0015BC4922|nr:GspH/FimT family pseudopilin [Pseudomonas taiwanensis]NWL79232.1 pilus assembly protein [Pseudomonas taiwanensis]